MNSPSVSMPVSVVPSDPPRRSIPSPEEWQQMQGAAYALLQANAEQSSDTNFDSTVEELKALLRSDPSKLNAVQHQLQAFVSSFYSGNIFTDITPLGKPIPARRRSPAIAVDLGSLTAANVVSTRAPKTQEPAPHGLHLLGPQPIPVPAPNYGAEQEVVHEDVGYSNGITDHSDPEDGYDDSVRYLDDPIGDDDDDDALNEDGSLVLHENHGLAEEVHQSADFQEILSKLGRLLAAAEHSSGLQEKHAMDTDAHTSEIISYLRELKGANKQAIELLEQSGSQFNTVLKDIINSAGLERGAHNASSLASTEEISATNARFSILTDDVAKMHAIVSGMAGRLEEIVQISSNNSATAGKADAHMVDTVAQLSVQIAAIAAKGPGEHAEAPNPADDGLKLAIENLQGSVDSLIDNGRNEEGSAAIEKITNDIAALTEDLRSLRHLIEDSAAHPHDDNNGGYGHHREASNEGNPSSGLGEHQRYAQPARHADEDTYIHNAQRNHAGDDARQDDARYGADRRHHEDHSGHHDDGDQGGQQGRRSRHDDANDHRGQRLVPNDTHEEEAHQGRHAEHGDDTEHEEEQQYAEEEPSKFQKFKALVRERIWRILFVFVFFVVIIAGGITAYIMLQPPAEETAFDRNTVDRSAVGGGRSRLGAQTGAGAQGTIANVPPNPNAQASAGNNAAPAPFANPATAVAPTPSGNPTAPESAMGTNGMACRIVTYQIQPNTIISEEFLAGVAKNSFTTIAGIKAENKWLIDGSPRPQILKVPRCGV
jgi:hypothetical protein